MRTYDKVSFVEYKINFKFPFSENQKNTVIVSLLQQNGDKKLIYYNSHTNTIHDSLPYVVNE